MTPLHLAVESGNIKKVDYLFDQGADIDIQDDNGVILNSFRLADLASFSGKCTIGVCKIIICQYSSFI